MAFDGKKNFLWAGVTEDIGTDGIVITLDTLVSEFPTPPFNLVCWPGDTFPDISNAEIIRVTAIDGGDSFNISRAQEGTIAQYIVQGFIVMLAPTAKSFTDIEAGVIRHGDPPKTTPVDADEMGLLDSAAAWAKKVLSWGNLKAALKTYFDGLYAAIGHDHSGTYAPASHASQHAADGQDSIWGQTVPRAVSDATLVFTFPNPQAGDTAWVQVPYDCYVLAWTVTTDGSVTLDVWQDELNNYPPTDADAMPGEGEEPTCDGTDFASGPATNWAVQDIDADCVVMAHVDSASGATFATLQLKVRKYLQ